MAYAGGGGEGEGEVVSPPAAARVNCSICGKLLPKLDGSKVYRCGDCNAALQAKGPPTAVSVKATTSSEKKSSKFLVGTPSVKKEKEPSSFGSSSGVASEKGGGGSLCHGRSRESNGSNTSRSDSGEESRIGSSFTNTKLNSDCTAKCKETQIGPGNGNPRYRRISKPMLYHPQFKQSVDTSGAEATQEREDVGGMMDSPAVPTPQFFPPYKHPDQHPSEILTKIDVIRDHLNGRAFNKNPNPLPMTSSYHDQPYNNFRRLPYEQQLNPTPSGVPESSYHPIQHHHHHQPSQCSCQQCHNCHWQLHQPLPPTGFQSRTLPCVVPGNYMFSSMDLLQSSGNSQMRNLPKKSLSRNMYKRECRPFAHGAPFIMCNNCFELLQFPCDLLNAKDLNRVECGSCSQVITFKLAGKWLVVESDESKRGNEAAGNPSPLQQVEEEEEEEEGNKLGIVDSSKYETTTYNGPSLHDILSTSASNILQPASLPPSSNVSKEGIEQCGESPPLSERRKRFEEMVDDFNDNSASSFSTNHSNLGASKNSSYVSNEEDDEHKLTGESFIVKVFKTGLSRPKGKGKGKGKGKAKVFVNGHPITDRLVRKAEKQAGSIQPGEYWYDYRAGFWGIMGQPCFGIIPSFIEEFNYPMAPKCAAGTTSILVNGRELHEQDLKLLADRGLPTSRGRSYIIEMSGEVTDAITGEELDALGKLAPTIEKLKQGFGMRCPKVAAA